MVFDDRVKIYRTIQPSSGRKPYHHPLTLFPFLHIAASTTYTYKRNVSEATHSLVLMTNSELSQI